MSTNNGTCSALAGHHTEHTEHFDYLDDADWKILCYRLQARAGLCIGWCKPKVFVGYHYVGVETSRPDVASTRVSGCF